MNARIHPLYAAWVALVLLLGGCATAQTSRMAEAPMSEAGRPVQLAMVLFRPPGDGPFPLVLVNHGSTVHGDNSDRFRLTWAPVDLAVWFVRRAWMLDFT